jgi:hypothetical protein
MAVTLRFRRHSPAFSFIAHDFAKDWTNGRLEMSQAEDIPFPGWERAGEKVF